MNRKPPIRETKSRRGGIKLPSKTAVPVYGENHAWRNPLLSQWPRGIDPIDLPSIEQRFDSSTIIVI